MITKLVLKNWLSHQNTEIEFLEGRNLILGPNGAGKTSIVEAIYFSLFGDVKGSYRGSLDRSKLIRHKEKEAFLSLEFVLNGELYRVERKITKTGKGSKSEATLFKGKKLLAEGTESVNKLLMELWDMDKDVFTNILYGGQEMLGNFLKQSPREQKEILDKTFKIHKIKHYIEGTKKVLSEIDKSIGEPVDPKKVGELSEKLEEARKEISKRKSLLKEKEEVLKKQSQLVDALKVKLERLKTLKEKWDFLQRKQQLLEGELKSYSTVERPSLEKEQSLIKEVKSLQNEIETLQSQLNQIIKKIAYHQSLLKQLEQLKKEENSLKERIKRLQEQLSQIKPQDPKEIKNKISKLEEEMGALKQEARSYQEQIKEIKKGMGKSTCPVCKRPLTQDHIKSLIQEYNEKIKKLKEVYLKKLGEKQRLEENLKEIERLEKLHQKINTQIQELSLQWDTVKKKLTSILEEIKSLDIKDIEEQKTELEKKIKERLQTLKNLEIELKKYTEEKRKWERKEAILRDLEQTKQELEKLSFKPKELEETLERYHENLARYNSLKQEIEQLKETLNVWNSLHKELSSQYEELFQKYEKQQKLQKLKKELLFIQEALEEGQKTIRQEIVASINTYLPELWETLSPTRYYQAPHLSYEYVNKTVGHAYKFYIQSPMGQLEAQMLSGGEKSIYMLSLKLALVKLLSKSSLLILDEPTQSMDEQAVKSLSEAISNLTGEEIKQFIVITHNELLKEADWDRVIKVEKKGEGNYKYSQVEVF